MATSFAGSVPVAGEVPSESQERVSIDVVADCARQFSNGTTEEDSVEVSSAVHNPASPVETASVERSSVDSAVSPIPPVNRYHNPRSPARAACPSSVRPGSGRLRLRMRSRFPSTFDARLAETTNASFRQSRSVMTPRRTAKFSPKFTRCSRGCSRRSFRGRRQFRRRLRRI